MPPENPVQRGGGQRAPARQIAPGRGGAMASGVPHQNVDRLNAAVAAIEKLKDEVTDVRKNAEERAAILYRKTVLLEAELAASCKCIRYLEKLAGYPESEDETERGDANGPRESAQGAATSGEQQVAEGDSGGNGAVSLQTVESIARSRYWMDKKEIKDIVAIALKKLMSVSGLDAKNLPAYPAEDDEWPLHPQIRDQRLLRLDWGSNHDSPINSAALETVRKWIRANGKVELTGSAVALQEIVDGDLGARIMKKFTYMRDQYRRCARLLGIATPGPGTRAPSVAPHREGSDFEGGGDANGEGEGGGDGEGDEHGEGGGHGGIDGGVAADGDDAGVKALFRSRAESKCEQRKRKAAGTEWADAKYETAFTVNAMSDDEDDPHPNPAQAIQYITRRPWYRSDELNALYAAVDSLADPDPDAAKKMTVRVSLTEEKKGVEPVRARTLKTRLRAWMIKPEVLAANPHWFRSGRVAKSGRAWGDAEDPEEDIGTSKGKGQGGRGVKFRRMDDAADVQAARAKYDELTGGRNVSAMFMQ